MIIWTKEHYILHLQLIKYMFHHKGTPLEISDIIPGNIVCTIYVIVKAENTKVFQYFVILHLFNLLYIYICDTM